MTKWPTGCATPNSKRPQTLVMCLQVGRRQQQGRAAKARLRTSLQKDRGRRQRGVKVLCQTAVLHQRAGHLRVRALASTWHNQAARQRKIGFSFFPGLKYFRSTASNSFVSITPTKCCSSSSTWWASSAPQQASLPHSNVPLSPPLSLLPACFQARPSGIRQRRGPLHDD